MPVPLEVVRGRTTVVALTNKSGGTVVQGDVVILNAGVDESFTTTTTAYLSTVLAGVVLDASIANDALGRIAIAGFVPRINLAAAATRLDYLYTHSVAKQGTSSASLVSGAFAQALEAGATPSALLWGRLVSLDMALQLVITVEGDVVLATVPLRFYNRTGTTKTIIGVYIAINTPPTGSALIADILKNGTTIFTNSANRPQIASGANSGQTTTIDVPSWANGDYLQLQIDQVGSTSPGSHLTVQVVY